MANINSSYMNLKGTTLDSFKIGPRGIKLASQALDDGQKRLFAKYINKNNEEVSNKVVYDIDLESYVSYKIDTVNDQFVLVFRDSSGNKVEVNLPRTFTSSGVIGPDSSKDSEFALFDGIDGKKIKGSGMTLETAVPENLSDTTTNSTIPTTKAVVDYVGKISDLLQDRMNGKL